MKKIATFHNDPGEGFKLIKSLKEVMGVEDGIHCRSFGDPTGDAYREEVLICKKQLKAKVTMVKVYVAGYIEGRDAGMILASKEHDRYTTK